MSTLSKCLLSTPFLSRQQVSSSFPLLDLSKTFHLAFIETTSFLSVFIYHQLLKCLNATVMITSTGVRNWFLVSIKRTGSKSEEWTPSATHAGWCSSWRARRIWFPWQAGSAAVSQNSFSGGVYKVLNVVPSIHSAQYMVAVNIIMMINKVSVSRSLTVLGRVAQLVK